MMQTPVFETTARERERRTELLERMRQLAIRDRDYPEFQTTAGIAVDIDQFARTPWDRLTLARCIRAGLAEKCDIHDGWYCITYRAFDLIGPDDLTDRYDFGD